MRKFLKGVRGRDIVITLGGVCVKILKIACNLAVVCLRHCIEQSKKLGVGGGGGAGVPNEVSGEYVVYMQDFS